MIADLIQKAIGGLIKIAVGAAEDAQKREAEQLVALQEFYDKGAAETRALTESFEQQSTETKAAFAAARERLKRQAEDTNPG